MSNKNQETISTQNPPLTILRLPKVKHRTGLSRSSIYQKISKGEFPKPVLLGARCVGWLEDEITTWIEQQIQSSRCATRSKNA